MTTISTEKLTWLYVALALLMISAIINIAKDIIGPRLAERKKHAKKPSHLWVIFRDRHTGDELQLEAEKTGKTTAAGHTIYRCAVPEHIDPIRESTRWQVRIPHLPARTYLELVGTTEPEADCS